MSCMWVYCARPTLKFGQIKLRNLSSASFDFYISGDLSDCCLHNHEKNVSFSSRQTLEEPYRKMSSHKTYTTREDFLQELFSTLPKTSQHLEKLAATNSFLVSGETTTSSFQNLRGSFFFFFPSLSPYFTIGDVVVGEPKTAFQHHLVLRFSHERREEMLPAYLLQ